MKNISRTILACFAFVFLNSGTPNRADDELVLRVPPKDAFLITNNRIPVYKSLFDLERVLENFEQRGGHIWPSKEIYGKRCSIPNGSIVKKYGKELGYFIKTSKNNHSVIKITNEGCNGFVPSKWIAKTTAVRAIPNKNNNSQTAAYSSPAWKTYYVRSLIAKQESRERYGSVPIFKYAGDAKKMRWPYVLSNIPAYRCLVPIGTMVKARSLFEYESIMDVVVMEGTHRIRCRGYMPFIFLVSSKFLAVPLKENLTNTIRENGAKTNEVIQNDHAHWIDAAANAITVSVLLLIGLAWLYPLFSLFAVKLKGKLQRSAGRTSTYESSEYSRKGYRERWDQRDVRARSSNSGSRTSGDREWKFDENAYEKSEYSRKGYRERWDQRDPRARSNNSGGRTDSDSKSNTGSDGGSERKSEKKHEQKNSNNNSGQSHRRQSNSRSKAKNRMSKEEFIERYIRENNVTDPEQQRLWREKLEKRYDRGV